MASRVSEPIDMSQVGTTIAWRKAPSTKIERRIRRHLSHCIRLARKFEQLARPSFRRARGRFELEVVVYGLLIRVVHLAEGIRDVGRGPAPDALLRSQYEAHVNSRFIQCDPALQHRRANDFLEFAEVESLRLRQEIANRVPRLAMEADLPRIKARLKRLEARFKHGRQWQWHRSSLVDRVVEIAKFEAEMGSSEDRQLRTIALYRESNSHVHGGMFSIWQSLSLGGRQSAVRPKQLEPLTSSSAALLSAALVVDTIVFSQETLGCRAIEAAVQRAGARGLELSKHPKRRGSD